MGLCVGGDDLYEMVMLVRGFWYVGELGVLVSCFGEFSVESWFFGFVLWCNGGWLVVRNRFDKYLGNKRYLLVRFVWFLKGRRCGVVGYWMGYVGEVIRRLVYEKLVYGVYDVFVILLIVVMVVCRVNVGKCGLDVIL